jgi:hypothetical protein
MTADDVARLVEAELRGVLNTDTQMRIRAWGVGPYPIQCSWEQGRPGERFTCWVVAVHSDYNAGVGYCEQGFGPQTPWAVINLSAGTVADQGRARFRSLEKAVDDL